MAYTLQELHDEIEADSEGLGYKEANGDWKGDGVIAGLINDPVNGTTIERSLISPAELIEQIVIAEWRVLVLEDRQYVDLLTALPVISTVSGATEIRDALLAIFGGGTVTRTNLIATVQRQGSRSEVLWGEDTYVSIGDVGHAANL